MLYEIPLPSGNTVILTNANGKNYALLVEFDSLPKNIFGKDFPEPNEDGICYHRHCRNYYVSRLSTMKKYLYHEKKRWEKRIINEDKIFDVLTKSVKIIPIKPVGGFMEITPPVHLKLNRDIFCPKCSNKMEYRVKDLLKEVVKCNEESFFYCNTCERYWKIYYANGKNKERSEDDVLSSTA